VLLRRTGEWGILAFSHKGKEKMKTLNPKVSLEVFFEQMGKAVEKALLLDYDGTLSPFHRDPSKAYPYPEVRDVVNRIKKSGEVRVVIITGRWIRDLLPLLKLTEPPEIWGLHGMERLNPDGSYELAAMEEKALLGIVTADEQIEAMGLSGQCEKKPGCVALHWRGMSEKEVQKIRDKIKPKWTLMAETWGLDLLEFDGGLELKVPARNKGDAVKTILDEMANDTVAAYLGDDLTDEDAFEAMKGRGISVLVREQLRPTAADIWIRPPEELLAFLSLWLPAKEGHLGA
jgi:trehalose 6-phosphate phosphatase